MNANDTMQRLLKQIHTFDGWTHKQAAVVVTLFVALVFTLSSLLAPQRSGLAQATGAPASLGEVTVTAERNTEAAAEAQQPQVAEEEILWLARGIYSETKQPHEQELVAWSVRNRVETAYRGQNTYKDVILDPWQYSAFNRNSPKRSHYMSLSKTSREPGWQKALAIAEQVATAPESERPFSETTRHFYSERSMAGQQQPNWAANRAPEKLDRWVDPERFRFYADVA